MGLVNASGYRDCYASNRPSGALTTRSLFTSTPSSANRAACNTGFDGGNFPLEYTTRHHGNLEPIGDASIRPAAREALGRPALAAMSPKLTTSPGERFATALTNCCSNSVTARLPLSFVQTGKRSSRCLKPEPDPSDRIQFDQASRQTYRCHDHRACGTDHERFQCEDSGCLQ